MKKILISSKNPHLKRDKNIYKMMDRLMNKKYKNYSEFNEDELILFNGILSFKYMEYIGNVLEMTDKGFNWIRTYKKERLEIFGIKTVFIVAAIGLCLNLYGFYYQYVRHNPNEILNKGMVQRIDTLQLNLVRLESIYKLHIPQNTTIKQNKDK